MQTLKPITTEPEESKQSQKSVEDETESSKQSGEYIIEREYLSDSPIALIKNPDKGWFAALGTKRLTDYHEKKANLIKHIGMWGFKVVLMSAIAEDMYNEKNKTK